MPSSSVLLNALSQAYPSQSSSISSNSDAFLSSSSPSTVSMPQKRLRKSSRPATAPAKEDIVLLPSLNPSSRMQLLSSDSMSNMQTVNEDECCSDHSSSTPVTPMESATMVPNNSLHIHTASSTMNGVPEFSSVSPVSRDHTVALDAAQSHPVTSYRSNYTNYTDSYDWGMFISAYASGRWDPHKTPNPPVSTSGNSSLGLGIHGLGHHLPPALDTSLSKATHNSSGTAFPEHESPADTSEEITPIANSPPMSVSENPPSVSKRPYQEVALSTNNIPQSHPPSSLYPKSLSTHRLRNPFSSAGKALPSPSSPSFRKGKQAQVHSTVPLGSSLSAGATRKDSNYKAQKAKADLFLTLPHRLPFTSSSGLSPGVQVDRLPSTPLQYAAALQSNALYTNTHYSQSDESPEPSPTKLPSSSPSQPIHSTSEPVPILHEYLPSTSPPSLTKPGSNSSASSSTISIPTPTSSTSSRNFSYQSSLPNTASTPHFPPFHSPSHLHTQHLPQFANYVSSSRHDYSNVPTLNAATIRLAGTNVNISPLALPSPEYELTDPMRNVGPLGGPVCVTVPGTLPDDQVSASVDDETQDGTLSDYGVLFTNGENGHPNGMGGTSGKELFKVHTRNTSLDLKKLGERPDSREGKEGEFGRDRDSGEFGNSIVTTPGGTRRRMRISMELKKFWEGTMDVDQPGTGDAHSRGSAAEEGSTVPKGKNKTVKIRTPEVDMDGAEDDYFSRGKEFSASSLVDGVDQVDGGVPQLIVPTSELIIPSTDSHERAGQNTAPDAGAAVEKEDSTHTLAVTDSERLTSSPQPISETISPSGSELHSLGAPKTVPTSISLPPAPMLSSYSFPYPYDHAHVHLHPTGVMSVPVPPSTSNPARDGMAGITEELPHSLTVGPFSGGYHSEGSSSGASVSNTPRRVNLTRQTSAPLPVGSGSSATLSGGMGIGIGMPPHVLPSVSEREKSEMVGLAGTIGGVGNVTPPNMLSLDGSGEVSSSAVIHPTRGSSLPPPSGLSASTSANLMGPLGSQNPGVRAAKEEQMYLELGYLAPPNPPDELERRRALYKFNIWNTGSDLNFDRIAHLAKLVFNTKGVFISLVDGNEQWFKSEWGVKLNSCARTQSFCAHTILQRDDEPMVILDTLQDWRFARNPQVVGHPHIRFYAGAPLRTQDGYNVGSLAVIDDSPREEFTPRHRHTLKEFAAIAMREMELWRDKIQLRIRDRIQNSMEQFSRECLEIDMEEQNPSASSRQESPANTPNQSPSLLMPSSMDRVYDRAAKLVQRTLDVEGVIVMDVSHIEVLENMSSEGSVSVVMHHGDPDITETTVKNLTAEEYSKLNAFFAKYPDGRISEGIVPPSFRLFLPTSRIQYALTVPIYNIDKRPFALLCAYNASDHTKRFLEGHELSYLRAIGVIILSAVLKRRMILADKAKSLFISNISHELRTPLHGILAAAELLSDTDLNHSQASFLQTVQACGTSLVETVNHVLDFTKLSGNSKAGGVENVIVSSKVDLMQLVEEAVDGCWIGHRARTAIVDDSGIGSVYSPPKEDDTSSNRKHVETVVDISDRKEGWLLKCEKGGIRRVLMNVFGNSLKFTSDGYVHVMLRTVPAGEDDPPDKVKIELSVQDTGKGISQNFLKNQLFHPFSQENPLQTGTGLGLAIVNSIVTSDSVGGKVDVWSEEGVGTEIKVTFCAELPEDADETSVSDTAVFKFDDPEHPPSISLIGFESTHRGVQLLRSVLTNYLITWGFDVRPAGDLSGDIFILNEDVGSIVAATERRDTSHPFIVLSASRGMPTMMSIASEHELIGGFCRIVFKPGGPSRIRSVLKLCLHALKIGSQNSTPMVNVDNRQVTQGSFEANGPFSASAIIPRRNSEDTYSRGLRPAMSPRSTTVHSNAPTTWKKSMPVKEEEKEDDREQAPDPEANEPTITLDSGGTLLKSSMNAAQGKEQNLKVLVVEDNVILRDLLVKWLKKKGYEFRDAVDGRDGVNVYARDGPFDVVLLDLSMPVLDGIGATAEIRQLETGQQRELHPWHSRILALTGMSSLEDKRRAFEAGVDGYLVKPVPFKTLDEVFHKLGFS